MIRRGPTPAAEDSAACDATTAAFFSDDEVTSTMILKPETPAASPARREPDIDTRLAKIDSLRERGLIPDDEASTRREETLDEI